MGRGDRDQPERRQMKHPKKSDFETETTDADVAVTFQPTKSTYKFSRLADPGDVAKHGPISADPNVRHAATGDTGDYSATAVLQMAHSVALDAVRHHRP